MRGRVIVPFVLVGVCLLLGGCWWPNCPDRPYVGTWVNTDYDNNPNNTGKVIFYDNDNGAAFLNSFDASVIRSF